MKLFYSKILFFLVLIFSSLFSNGQNNSKAKGYYQIIVYNFATAEQQRVIDEYIKTAYIPALHRNKISNVGVFTPILNDTAISKKLFVIIPLKSFEQAALLTDKINKDEQYLINSKDYKEAVYSNPPFQRIENILLEKFVLAPFFNLPKLTGSKANRIYELRSYESATEKLFANKVEMFNEGGEIDLFKKLNFNAVFFAKVIAGSHMPNLMYMTSFENIADREAHWKSFVASEEWKKISNMPYYQNNISHMDIMLMKATEYSDY